jgi:formylglycine-generating enzyme required for sulfatase activity
LFRLPTAEEWEYACRAGSKGDYCLRDDGVEITAENLDTVSWGDGVWNCDSEDLPPVGRKRANAFGLHDMLGMVGEWTSSNDRRDGIYCGLRAKASSRESQPAFEDNIKDFVSAMGGIGFRLCAERRAD